MTTVTVRAKILCLGLDPHLEADARIILADLDGCLMSEGKAYEDAPNFVAACGTRLWPSNIDVTHPSLKGRPLPKTDTLFAALRAVVGPVDYTGIRKPDPHLSKLVTERTGINAQGATLVGDTAETNGALARSTGMPFLQVVRERQA